MIEVNLHPEGKKRGRRAKAGLVSGVRQRLEGMGDVELLESLRSDPWNAAFVATLVVSVALGLFLWMGQRSHAAELQERLDAAMSDSTRLSELGALSDSLMERRRRIEERVELVAGLDRNRYVWPHLMDEISAALPDAAWLETIKRRGGLPGLEVQLMGTAATPLVVTDFVRTLEASPYIGQVEIVTAARKVSGGISSHEFTLDLRYTPPPLESVRTVPVTAMGR